MNESKLPFYRYILEKKLQYLSILIQVELGGEKVKYVKVSVLIHKTKVFFLLKLARHFVHVK